MFKTGYSKFLNPFQIYLFETEHTNIYLNIKYLVTALIYVRVIITSMVIRGATISRLVESSRPIGKCYEIIFILCTLITYFLKILQFTYKMGLFTPK